MNSELTILFCSCDSYKDLWMPFFTIFQNRWKDCEYPILINTESETYKYKNLDINCLSLYTKNQKVSYGQRMIDHLKTIKSEFTLILLDDFFLREDVDSKKIKLLIEYMKNNQAIDSIRITPFQHRETYDKCTMVKDLPGYYQLPLCAGYKLNMQACIWRTMSLINYWKPEDDPWRWEVFANITTFNKAGFLVVGEKEGPVLDYGYKVDGQPLSDVYRGKWVMENGLQELFEKNSIDFDFSIRGRYDPQNEKKHFQSLDTIRYVVKRIGFGNTMTLAIFVGKNAIRKFFHLEYQPYSKYYIAFEKKYRL